MVQTPGRDRLKGFFNSSERPNVWTGQYLSRRRVIMIIKVPLRLYILSDSTLIKVPVRLYILSDSTLRKVPVRLYILSDSTIPGSRTHPRSHTGTRKHLQH